MRRNMEYLAIGVLAGAAAGVLDRASVRAIQWRSDPSAPRQEALRAAEVARDLADRAEQAAEVLGGRSSTTSAATRRSRGARSRDPRGRRAATRRLSPRDVRALWDAPLRRGCLMGLHLVTGPAAAGKSGLLYAEIERASREGSPVLALPAIPDVHRASAEFAARGILGVKVIQLDQLVDSLWRLHGDGRRIVSPSRRHLMVGRVLGDLVERGHVQELGDSLGLRRLLGEIVGSIPVRDLTLPKTGATADVAAVCRAYWQELEDVGYIEAAQAACLLGSDPPHGLGSIALNRFTDLTVGQELLIIGLSAVADVTIALTWQEGLPATAALDPLVSRLLARSGTAHTVVPAGEWSDPALEVLADGLFRGVRRRPDGASNCWRPVARMRSAPEWPDAFGSWSTRGASRGGSPSSRGTCPRGRSRCGRLFAHRTSRRTSMWRSRSRRRRSAGRCWGCLRRPRTLGHRESCFWRSS